MRNKVITVVMVVIVIFAGATSVNANTQWINITQSMQAIDQLDGVQALYRQATVTQDASDSTYSCAAYVKRYFSQIYHVDINNLLMNNTPRVSSGELIAISDPRKGDLAFWTTMNHSAIVKSSRDNTVVLIEQNWKWNGKAAYEREISRYESGVCFYRWQGGGSFSSNRNSDTNNNQSSNGTVTFYEHHDGQGWSYSCNPNRDVRNAGEMGFANDQLSSIRVSGSNIIVEIYEHDNFNGRKLTFDREGLFNLGPYDFNDICSSYKVRFK